MASLRNWWCPKCQKWVASAELDLTRRHSCGTKVEWREFNPCGSGCVLKGGDEEK